MKGLSSKNMGPVCSLEMSVLNQPTLSSNPEDGRIRAFNFCIPVYSVWKARRPHQACSATFTALLWVRHAPVFAIWRSVWSLFNAVSLTLLEFVALLTEFMLWRTRGSSVGVLTRQVRTTKELRFDTALLYRLCGALYFLLCCDIITVESEWPLHTFVAWLFVKHGGCYFRLYYDFGDSSIQGKF